MYNKLTRSATTSSTAIRIIGACSTAPAAATHRGEIAKLAQENAKQREKIAELEATIEQLKLQHDQDLETIYEDLTKLAIWSAQEKELEATVRYQFIARAVKAEVCARRLTAYLAAIKDKQANMRSIEMANKTFKCHERKTNRLVQPVDKLCSKQVGKAVERQNMLINGLVQPANKLCNGLVAKAVEHQDKQASETKKSADNLADKQAIPKKLYDQVSAIKNKITRYKEMANKIVELIRAHQCRLQLNNQSQRTTWRQQELKDAL
ncbi:hypothetical protein GGH20_001177 [Coemansia sp. RSA 1937]|nr:hypothetical protein GGH20_001177 [Coemansia sp. RSA 1937]